MTTTTVAALREGSQVRFLQKGRTERIQSKKGGAFEYADLPDRVVQGTVTAISRGEAKTQITVKTPDGTATAHVPSTLHVEILD